MGKSRNILWGICLLLLALVCGIWSSFPTLEASPLMRVALFSGAGIIMLGMVFSFPSISDLASRRLILIAAVFLRLVLWPAPVSDDVNRYVWEGRLVLHGENPYSATADDPRWEKFRDEIWEGINHRNLPTAYPPGIQWVMAATTAVCAHPFAFKVLALAGDLATLLLLFALFRQRKVPLRWMGFYAFNPVVLISFAAEAHFDSLMTAALLGALLAAERNRRSAWLWLGVAIQLKLICVILIPLFMVRKLLPGAWLLLPVLILPTLPFLTGFSGWGNGVSLFALGGTFNAPLFSLLTLAGIGHGRELGTLTFAIIAGAIVIRRWRGLDLIDASLWLLAALLICSPVVHFWYLTWLLPLVALRPSFAWTTVSITIGAYFIAWWTKDHAGWWGFGHRITALIWVPWFAAWMLQNRVSFSWLRAKRAVSETAQPCVIVPVLNPGSELKQLVTTLQMDCGADQEIVIVDGGSKENPIPDAMGTGSRLISSPRGRGNQIAAGVAASRAPWILIAHADITPRAGWREDLAIAIRHHPEASMFVFGQRFDTGGPGTLLIEILNEMRAIFTGVAFGDQTMVIRRSALESAGGFPAQPLMEDVETSLRLKSCGRVVYIAQEWIVSARKWNIGRWSGFSSRVGMIARLYFSYWFARLRGPAHAAAVAEQMYQSYYPGIPKTIGSPGVVWKQDGHR